MQEKELDPRSFWSGLFSPWKSWSVIGSNRNVFLVNARHKYTPGVCLSVLNACKKKKRLNVGQCKLTKAFLGDLCMRVAGVSHGLWIAERIGLGTAYHRRRVKNTRKPQL